MWKQILIALLAVGLTVSTPLFGLPSLGLPSISSSPGVSGTTGVLNIGGVSYPGLTPSQLSNVFPQLSGSLTTLTAPLSFTSSSTGSVISAVDKTNINNLSSQIVGLLGQPLSNAPGIAALLTQVLYAANYGATIQFVNGQLMIGGVSLPSYLTCQTFGTNLAACQICNYDCVYVHNTYGGFCAQTPNLQNSSAAPNYACVCQTEPNANNTIVPVQDVCGSIAGAELDPITSLAILQFLYVREQAELCIPSGNGTFIGAGCNVDCPRNHQYASGTCEVTQTVPFTPDQAANPSAQSSQTFCICSFANSTSPIEAQPTTVAPTTVSS
jgi:hypothetical protein